MKLFCVIAFVAALFTPHLLCAAEPAAGGRVTLPQAQPYQQQLRQFMATLKEANFQPDNKNLTAVPVEGDDDVKFRTWIMSLQVPPVGRKRNQSSVMVKASLFTLDAIEGPTAIMRPPAYPEPLVQLASFNYAGNPYFNSRPLRMRAFVLAALDMIMLDELLDSTDPKTRPSPDHVAACLGRFAYTYTEFSPLLPDEVKTAYLAGVRRLAGRVVANGPKAIKYPTLGLYPWAPYSLAVSAKILHDAELAKQAEAYARTVFTDPAFFRAAGYFPHGGTLDSFNGISLNFAIWSALEGEWPFAREAVARAYRLKAHLTLPEPDGVLMGPSHFASLTSAESVRDQWGSKARDWAASMVSDEAAAMTPMPTEAEIATDSAAIAGEINFQLQELYLLGNGLNPSPWNLQPPSFNNNRAFQYYPKNFYAHRRSLDKQGDLALLPALREDSFVHVFDNEFVFAKTPAFAAILHTGPIADPSDSDSGFGFGGGALAAFWTRATGSVILGRGIGAWSPQYKTVLAQWRSIPSHAVNGVTSDGHVFTSAHIVKPEVTIESKDTACVATAHGILVPLRQGGQQPLAGKFEYTRKFESSATGVRVTTTLKGDGKDTVAELYESIPVSMGNPGAQSNLAPTVIEFQVNGKWLTATESFAEKVTAARLSRFNGAVQITFDHPCRAKLAPRWADTYQTQAACQNILIDLLDSGDKPVTLNDTRKCGYKIEPVTK